MADHVSARTIGRATVFAISDGVGPWAPQLMAPEGDWRREVPEANAAGEFPLEWSVGFVRSRAVDVPDPPATLDLCDDHRSLRRVGLGARVDGLSRPDWRGRTAVRGAWMAEAALDFVARAANSHRSSQPNWADLQWRAKRDCSLRSRQQPIRHNAERHS